MNIFQRLLQNFARKSRTFRGAYAYGFGSPNWSKRDYDSFARNGYAGNPYCYAAINALRDAVVQPPPILYRVKEKGQIEQAMEREYDYVKALNGVSSRKWSKETCARQIIRKGTSKIIKSTGIHPSIARRIAVKQMSFTGELEEIDSHPVLDLLARPNGYYQTSYNEFVAAFVTSLMISGEVFTEPKGSRGAAGIPSDLYILPSHKFTSATPKDGNPLPSFKYAGREPFLFSPDAMETEIFFSKLYDPANPLRGLSPMEAALRSIDLNNEGRKYNLSYMQNSGVPPGLVTGEFDEIQAGEFRDAYDQEVAGSENAGRLLTIGGKNLKYHQLGVDASKLLWGDTITLTAREISMIFNVAPEIIGDSASRTYCLPYGSSIATPNGRKCVGEIRPDDEVYSFDPETGEVKPNRVLWQAKTGRKRIYRITGRGFSLEASGNHPVLTIDRSEIKNHRGGGIEFVPRFTYKGVGKLRVGDIVVRAHTYPDTAVDDPLPLDEMEFYGAMLGDGFAKNSNVSMAGIDGPVRDFYAGVLVDLVAKPLDYREREVRVYNRAFVRVLEDLGLTGKAVTKRIPGWVFRQPIEQRTSFLRGLWDTDGSVDKTGRVTFHVANLELAKDVQRLCLSLGIQADRVQESRRMTRLPNGEEIENYLAGFKACVTAHNLVVGSRNPEDLRRMTVNHSRGWKGRRVAGTGANSYKRFMQPLLGNVEFCTIRSIELLGIQDVYDIEVEGAHNFFAENVVVHNSNYQEARLALYQDAALPLADFMFGHWNQTWLKRFGDNLLLDYDADQVDAIQDDVDKAYSRLNEAKFLTINEKRGAVGWEPITGGDVILVSIAEVPLEAALMADEEEREEAVKEIRLLEMPKKEVA